MVPSLDDRRSSAHADGRRTRRRPSGRRVRPSTEVEDARPAGLPRTRDAAHQSDARGASRVARRATAGRGPPAARDDRRGRPTIPRRSTSRLSRWTRGAHLLRRGTEGRRGLGTLRPVPSGSDSEDAFGIPHLPSLLRRRPGGTDGAGRAAHRQPVHRRTYAYCPHLRYAGTHRVLGTWRTALGVAFKIKISALIPPSCVNLGFPNEIALIISIALKTTPSARALRFVSS